MTQIVTLSFFRFDGLVDRLWAFTMMGLARIPLSKTPDIQFWKLCGAGKGVGFTPTVNLEVCAILATWPSEEAARKGTLQSRIFQKYQSKSCENWTVYLRTTSVRGEWSGRSPFAPSEFPSDGPLAALTRATVKPSRSLKFWQRVPDISAVIGSDTNVLFKMGIGEVPLLQQVTFSIWPDTNAMANFARKDGPHARAIKAVRANDWFKEELYARFAVLGDHGTWGGDSPLRAKEISS